MSRAGCLRRRLLPCVGALSLLVMGAEGAARAEGPRDASSMAEALFDEGVRLLAAGDYARACPKLEESQRLDPGGGTILNLAKCYEGQRRWSSAWSAYRDGLSLARADGRADRVKVAEAGLASVAPHISRLTLVVAARTPGLEIAVDGVVIGPAAWDAAAPVDPGAHRVTASAPAHVPTTIQIDVSEGETKTVVVPELVARAPSPGEDEPRAGGGVTAGGAPGSGGGLVRGLGIGGVATGAVGIATGAVFGFLALDADRTANELCPGSALCRDARGLDASSRAHDFGTVATVSLVAGAVLAVTGVALSIAAR